jgi:hypothetical protein
MLSRSGRAARMLTLRRRAGRLERVQLDPNALGEGSGPGPFAEADRTAARLGLKLCS